MQEQSQGSTKLPTQRGLGFWWCLWLRELRGMNWPQRLGHFGSSGCRALTCVPVIQLCLPAKSLWHCQRLASHCTWSPQHFWEAAGKGHQVLLKIADISARGTTAPWDTESASPEPRRSPGLWQCKQGAAWLRWDTGVRLSPPAGAPQLPSALLSRR